jgi:hypothetical protein
MGGRRPRNTAQIKIGLRHYKHRVRAFLLKTSCESLTISIVMEKVRRFGNFKHF